MSKQFQTAAGVRSSIFIAVVFLAAGSLMAGQRGEGFLIDGRLISPVGWPVCSRCMVELQDMSGGSRTALTDSAGEFAFRDLQVQNYVVRFAMTGYEQVMRVVVASSDRMHVEIELKPIKSESVEKQSTGQVVHISSLLRAYPKEVVELYEKAATNHRKNKTAEALRQYEEVVRMAPGFSRAHDDLGTTYQALNRIGEAERAFLQAARLDPSSVEPLTHLASLYILRNDFEAAIRVSLDALRRDTRSAAAYFSLGLALYCDSKFDLAEGALEKALSLNPTSNEIRLPLINVYLRKRDWEHVVPEMDAYLKDVPRGSERDRISKLRDQSRKGGWPQQELEIPFSVKLGPTVRPAACRS